MQCHSDSFEIKIGLIYRRVQFYVRILHSLKSFQTEIDALLSMKIITKNKKAFFDYEILDTIEAGIVLSGDEVKSLRAGKVNMIGSFATFHNGEFQVINLAYNALRKSIQAR